MPLPFDSISDLQAAYRAKSLTPLDVVHDCFRAIDQYEKALQAWVCLDREGALSLAQKQGALSIDISSLPLFGIPLGIKDIIDVAGFASCCGSDMLVRRKPAMITPGQEAPIVTRLKKAGAIILGKTVTTEFACFDPAPTSNPWNLEHTPGGSSSGTAAAVASGMCWGALGTQTGGSILRPASYCGVVGYKPQHHEKSLQGIFPVSSRLDHVGPFARCVSDAWLLQQVLIGKETTKIPVAKDIGTLRLALLPELYTDSLQEEDANQFATRIGALKDAGAIVLEHRIDVDWQAIRLVHRQIMALDAYQVHAAHWPERFAELGPQLQGLLEEGRQISQKGIAYSTDLSHRQQAFLQVLLVSLQGVDAFLIPSTPTPAPASKLTTGDPQYNSPFSLAGLPAITIPYAQSNAGLPLGLQLVTATEDLLWPAALTVESLLGVSGFAAKHCPRR